MNKDSINRLMFAWFSIGVAIVVSLILGMGMIRMVFALVDYRDDVAAKEACRASGRWVDANGSEWRCSPTMPERKP